MTSVLSVNVPARERNYDIKIGYGALSSIRDLPVVAKASKICIIVDSGLNQSTIATLTSKFEGAQVAIHSVPSGESSKSPSGLNDLWSFLSKNGADRCSVILNVGGGMVGDLGGFAASTYMRGIPFIQVPTTLLSQVDASIGGKVAINFDGIKNLMGTITPPDAVIIDLDFLSTLPEREFRSGFAEIVKHGLIRDADLTSKLFSKDCRSWAPAELEAIVVRSCEIKRDVVQADPFEKGERKILNFGHTVGHALESLSHESKDPFQHGEAVALGMMIEANIAMRAGLLAESAYTYVVDGTKASGLITEVQSPFKLQRVLDFVSRDKKNLGSEVRWSLISAIGSSVYDQIIPQNIVEDSLKELCCG